MINELLFAAVGFFVGAGLVFAAINFTRPKFTELKADIIELPPPFSREDWHKRDVRMAALHSHAQTEGMTLDDPTFRNLMDYTRTLGEQVQCNQISLAAAMASVHGWVTRQRFELRRGESA